MSLRGQHRLWRGTGWVWVGGIFWARVFGWGVYRIRGERPYLLRPGRPPVRNVRASHIWEAKTDSRTNAGWENNTTEWPNFPKGPS